MTAREQWLWISGWVVGVVFGVAITLIVSTAHAAAPDVQPPVFERCPYWEGSQPAPIDCTEFSGVDIRIAYYGATVRAQCILRTESHLLLAGARADVRGAAAERGIAQLHPQGLLPLFYRQGWTDPDNPRQAAEFLDWALAWGLAGHWSGVLRGMC